MHYEPGKSGHNLAHDPFLSLVVPRPIGWISTLNRAGVVNLAPYSFFNAVSGRPPMVMFSSIGRKHTLVNAEESGEFVVNLASHGLRFEVNLTSAALPEDVSEAAIAGLELAPSQRVKPPRVARAPAALECRTVQIIPLRGADGAQLDGTIVIGQVVGIYIDDDVIANGAVDLLKIRPLSRLGYLDYTSITEVFSLDRPIVGPAAMERI
jgi:flavin reductase (DIM6/NTAB) family NADH-FMN oxidoreductase RutF